MECLWSQAQISNADTSNIRKAERGKKTRTILIVDYDTSTCRVFKQIFQKRGFTVDLAKDGEEAKTKMKENAYDAALISFILPDMDGLDLLFFTAKTMPKAAKIVTTGFPNLRNGIKVIEAGADAYFSKPIEPEELIRVVEEKLELLEKEKGNNPSTTKSLGVGGSSGSYKGRLGMLSGAC
jgi:two-component system response regulator HydG